MFRRILKMWVNLKSILATCILIEFWYYLGIWISNDKRKLRQPQIDTSRNITGKRQRRGAKRQNASLAVQSGIRLGVSNSLIDHKLTIKLLFRREQSINESITLLRESGFEFDKHVTDGIPHHLFAEYLISSGLVLNPKNHWITFHGAMDFGYLMKNLLG